ncbi:MAG: hypothetical protein K6A92_08260 [Lachnospiraceae bacterium]|nr:hypothetical protein [Lachnospiraceae bacterium]
MSLIAGVVDGQIQQAESATSANSKEKTTGSSSMDKEAFLQILVAQMKYQDPLEPTSNSEYISQYATFSELEQMQNVSQSVNMTRASSLIGQTVVMQSTDSGGNVRYVQGTVDYVQFEGSSAKLCIGGSYYDIDDLYSVLDGQYISASSKYASWTEDMAKLPDVEAVTAADLEKVQAVVDTYNNMSEYEVSFVTASDKALVESYYAQLEKLKEAQTEGE